jgi:hypothetical protein
METLNAYGTMSLSIDEMISLDGGKSKVKGGLLGILGAMAYDFINGFIDGVAAEL